MTPNAPNRTGPTRRGRLRRLSGSPMSCVLLMAYFGAAYFGLRDSEHLMRNLFLLTGTGGALLHTLWLIGRKR